MGGVIHLVFQSNVSILLRNLLELIPNHLHVDPIVIGFKHLFEKLCLVRVQKYNFDRAIFLHGRYIEVFDLKLIAYVVDFSHLSRVSNSINYEFWVPRCVFIYLFNLLYLLHFYNFS